MDFYHVFPPFSFILYSNWTVEIHKRLREFEKIRKRLRKFEEILKEKSDCEEEKS